MPSSVGTFEEEVARGDRFEFGRNWERFLAGLTVPQIKLAQASLVRLLGIDRLDGKMFLDIGSGSGLFSLVARRLGAIVVSFDYDPHSVGCTSELKRRYFPDDPNWTILQGSVLDEGFLATLGKFDIVYSWGVLHHTGAMQKALANVKPLVPIGGQLAIAIYNDQGEATDRWAAIKQRYNRLPRPLSDLYAAWIVARQEGAALLRHVRDGTSRAFFDHWRDYAIDSGRGMSRWHDWIDWIGGWPYERATVEQIADIYARDGFTLTHLVDRSSEYGCNEFAFRRLAEAGCFMEFRLPGGNSMARRFGHRVTGPFEKIEGTWHGQVHSCPSLSPGSRLLLVSDDAVLGPASINGSTVSLPFDAADSASLEARTIHLLAAEELQLDPPFQHVNGHQWAITVSSLAEEADTAEKPRGSSAYLFENGRQLPLPHAAHNDIARFGAGRFSHWGTNFYFSALDNADPNLTGRQYMALVARHLIPAGRSAAIDHGIPLEGPAHRNREGWAVSTGPLPAEWEGARLYLIHDDHLVGPVVPDATGHIIIADPEAPPALSDSAYTLIAADSVSLNEPIVAQRGLMWGISLPELTSIADTAGLPPRSMLYLFEDGAQLGFPHAPHDDIDRLGSGRFSHWESTLYFATSDGTDPRENGRTYLALICRPRPHVEAS